MFEDLTHLNENNEAHMVDIGDKTPTQRTAVASGYINISPKAMEVLLNDTSHKGNVLAVARVAAIQGTKQTSSLIPLCHPIALTHVRVDFEVDSDTSRIKAIVAASTEGQTGVEMEALTGVQVALLTIYDMLKAVDKTMTMTHIHLQEKHGGKSGSFIYADAYENLNL